MSDLKVPFSPPDIADLEIEYVTDVLKSGWITTGPRAKLFEEKIAEYCGCEKALTLNSGTAGLELALQYFGIKEGDEVITSVYTYAATINAIIHSGAKPILVDVAPESFHIDTAQVEQAYSNKTKAVITVDFAGYPCDYNAINQDIQNAKIKAANSKQEELKRPLLISDAAHAFGSYYFDRKVGSVADFTAFSFHAVKNLTTAEGGALTFGPSLDSETCYSYLRKLSLHGQNKDALAKTTSAKWEYDVIEAGFKYNMADINAAIGLAQLERYEQILANRKRAFDQYRSELADINMIKWPRFDKHRVNYHLLPIRLDGSTTKQKNDLIEFMFENNVAVNVHFKPLTMFTAFQNYEFRSKSYPNAESAYQEELSLPIFSTISEAQVEKTIATLKKAIGKIY